MFAGAVFSLVTLVASPLLAQATYTWGGSGTVDAPANWSVPGNWVGGTAPGYTGTVTIDNGHAKFSNNEASAAVLLSNGMFTIGGTEGNTASLTISGTKPVYLGNSANDIVTMNLLTGGTLYCSGAEFWVGRDVASIEAHLIIDGGSAGTSDKRLGNLVLRCANAKNSIELNSGWIYANTFRLAGSGAASTFNMTGGTLDVSGDFEIGRDSTQSIANISGGTLKIGTLKLQHWNGVDDNRGGGTLNIIGNKSDWTVGTLSGGISGKLNFIAGHVNEDGSVGFSASDSLDENGNVLPAFSTINVSGTATIKGTVTANFAEGFVSAIMPVSSTLVKAGTLAVTEMIVCDADNKLLEVTTDENSIVAMLAKDHRVGTLNLSNSISTISFDATQSGWVEFENVTPAETYALQLQFSGADSLDDWNLLTDYYAELFDDSVADDENQTVTLFGLSLNNDSAFLWDLASYNATVPYTLTGITTLDSNAVPEPATWAMLVIGVGALVLGRRKR